MKTAAVFCWALFLILSVSTPDSYCGLPRNNNSRFSRPGPRLLFPVTDDIVLSGKDHLEFKWTRDHLAQTDHFYFRLYKGYNTTAGNLAFKQDYSIDEYPISIPAALFENGQVYTWVLIQVFIGGEKSDRSFSSFKIIKK
ncbi:MAG: hypothetical protein WC723_04895 [Candidatus Omnitrophota bacterium]